VDVEQRYEVAVKAARSALENKNWAEAERQAAVALSLQSGDSTAESLRQKARDGLSNTLKLYYAWMTGDNKSRVIDSRTGKEAIILNDLPDGALKKLKDGFTNLKTQLNDAGIFEANASAIKVIENRLNNR
jgi:hypothetical protein